MEAKKPRVYDRKVIFLRRQDCLMYNLLSKAIDLKRIFHSLQFNFIENFMLWFQRSNVWLLTIGSQGEAKGKRLEMNVSQDAKVYGRYLIMVQKRDPFSVETYNRGQSTLRRYFIDCS